MSQAPTCPYCGKPSKLVDSKIIYGTSYGMIYDCRTCDAYVGVHKGTTTPLGRLANAELRTWKKRAHAAFDPFWQRPLAAEIASRGGHAPKGVKQKHRCGAYSRLAAALNIPMSECHIGMFDVDQCRAVVQACNQWTINEQGGVF